MKIISNLYQYLSSEIPCDNFYIKAKWEGETQEIAIEDCIELCAEIHQVTNSNSWREFQWKIVSRFFKTPLLTARAGSTPTSECWRNTHIFWTCPKLCQFWNTVFDDINRLFDIPIPQDFNTAILGTVPTGLEGRKNTYLLQILLIAAKKMITINWLNPHPPTYEQWRDKVREIRDMERITYWVRLQDEVINRRWAPLARIGIWDVT